MTRGMGAHNRQTGMQTLLHVLEHKQVGGARRKTQMQVGEGRGKVRIPHQNRGNGRWAIPSA